jgi:hypothetical protein
LFGLDSSREEDDDFHVDAIEKMPYFPIVVSLDLLKNGRLLPPPLTPPDKGREVRAMTDSFLPLDGGGKVGLKGSCPRNLSIRHYTRIRIYIIPT